VGVFTRFNSFVSDTQNGLNDPGLHPMKLALSNVLPNVGMMSFAQITEIMPGGGYVAGGVLLTVISSAQVGGLFKYVLQNFQLIATGNMAPWQYAVIYDSQTGSLVGWSDEGIVFTLHAAELVNFVFDQLNGLYQAIS